MRGFERLCILALVVGIRRIRVVAQTTSPVRCTTAQWTINREGQTPCQVAAALQGVCFDGVWNIDPIPPGKRYSGPLLGQSNKCQCNTVVFSLVAACGACQSSSFSTWPDWIANCTATDVTVAGYPLGIPQGTGVPAWAYLDVTISGNVWDPIAALAVANSNPAETTGGSLPATGAPSNGTSGTATSPAATSSTTSSSSSKAGPIAGGVVGGVVFLALLGVLGFFLYRRKYPRGRQPDMQHHSEKIDLVGAATPVPPYPDRLQSPTLPMQQEPPRLYDPSDPSTFPASPPPAFPTSPVPSHATGGAPGYTSPTPSQPTSPYHFSPSQRMSGYSGAPEV